MASVEEHYSNLLAKHYTWMTGASFEQKVAEQKALLETILETANSGRVRGAAIDLGCGPGYQAIALAELGFSPVHAIDTSPELLDELKAHTGSLPIQIVQADLTLLDDIETGNDVALVVCMGDTLTHLRSKEAVELLLAAVHRRLAPSGAFVIGYRDLSATLTGVDRVIPVRSNDSRIMTCFLEYESDEHVTVNDIVHVREDEGWRMEKSSYRKLRLPEAWVAEALNRAGFHIRSQGSAGRLLLIVAQKTAEKR